MATTPVAAVTAPAAALVAAPAPGVPAAQVATPGQTPFTSASLYVGDLRSDVTEGQLFDHFKACGTIASIRVCRDAITRRSLGYAYVNFHSAADAEHALDQLNYSQINGKPCRIMWSHRDPSKRKSGAGNIYIKNLAKSVNNQQLLDTFGTFGNILSCKVETDDNGVSKGYGYVHFEKEEDGKKAIEQLNGKLIAGEVVYVGPFIAARDRSATGGKEAKYTNIYIKNLDPTFTEANLKETFSAFGEITSAVLLSNSKAATESSTEVRGFAFVNFATHESAERAVAEMNGRTVNGKTLYVARAQKRSERERELKQNFERQKAENAAKNLGANLYVRNLADNITDEELRNLFAPFGTITSAKVMRDERAASRGFGFVCFSSPEESLKAISEMNGSIVNQKPLYVAQAQKKAVRSEQLRQFYSRQGYSAGPFLQQAQVWYQGRPFVAGGYPQQMMRGPWPPAQGVRRGAPYPYGVPVQGALLAGAGPQNPIPGVVPAGQPIQGQPQQFNRVQRNAGAIPAGQQARRGVAGGMPSGQQRAGVRKGAYPQAAAAPVAAAVVAAAPVAAVVPAAAPVAAAAVAQAEPAAEAGDFGSLSAEEFAAQAANPGELKQTLGERLFSRVSEYYPAQQKCGKITGMLLESMDLKELNGLLDDLAGLKQKIDEANVVYETHQAQAGAQ